MTRNSNTQRTIAFVGARHPHVFPRLELALARRELRVVGLYEPDDAIRSTIAQRYDVRTTDDLATLLQPSLDLVIIDGFDHENPRYVERVAGACRAMLIEKPGAPTLAHMEHLVATVRRHGVHAQVGYMYHYSPAIARARGILESGVLGAVTLARFHAAAPVGCGAEVWQSLPDDMGGAFFTDGCHMLDHVVHLLGEPLDVAGRWLKVADGPTVKADAFKAELFSGLGTEEAVRVGGLMYEDAAAAILTYPTLLATVDFTAWEAHDWVEAWEMTFYGTNGTLEVGLVPPRTRLWVRRAAAGYERGWHGWQGDESAVGPAASLTADENYRAEMEHLVAAAGRQGPPDLSRLEDALAVVRIVDAVYRDASAARPGR